METRDFSSGHRKFHRGVLIIPDDSDENSEPVVMTQSFTMSSTPSDHRAGVNAVAELRRKDSGVMEVRTLNPKTLQP